MDEGERRPIGLLTLSVHLFGAWLTQKYFLLWHVLVGEENTNLMIVDASCFTVVIHWGVTRRHRSDLVIVIQVGSLYSHICPYGSKFQRTVL